MKLVLLGGGGHARSVIDTLRSLAQFELVGILDTPERVGQDVDGVPILGGDSQLPALYASGVTHAFITVGSIKSTVLREQLYRKALDMGYKFPIVADVSALMTPSTSIGAGSFIGKGAIVNTGVKIGTNCIINSGAIIEHDCTIGDFSHVAPGAVLSGNVHIGQRSLVGLNATILQNTKVGNSVIIGGGSVVLHDVESYMTVAGNPAKEVK